MSAEKPKGVNTGRIITIVVGVALVAALAFFMIQYFQLKKTTEDQGTDIEELTAEIDDAQHEIEDYKLDLENQDLALEDKERLLAEKEQLIEDKQKRIDDLLRSNKITQGEAEKLRGKVEQLEYYIKKYQTEIDDLKAEIAMKDTQIQSLSGKVDTISGELQVQKRIAEEKDTKLEIAKILSADNFTFFRTKGSGKEIQETAFRRAQLDDLKICFKVAQNLAAEIGQKTAYIQILDPNGKAIKDDKKSGFFTGNQESMTYTTKTSFDFDHTAKKVCVTFVKPDNVEYESGVHRVVVYCDEVDIGVGTFTVK